MQFSAPIPLDFTNNQELFLISVHNESVINCFHSCFCFMKITCNSRLLFH